MKKMINYIACTIAISLAVVLILSNNLYLIIAGALWCGVLYLSGKIFPKKWKSYWMCNLRILSYFNSL